MRGKGSAAAHMRSPRIGWEQLPWTAVHELRAEGCNDAAFLGLDELPGNVYAAAAAAKEGTKHTCDLGKPSPPAPPQGTLRKKSKRRQDTKIAGSESASPKKRKVAPDAREDDAEEAMAAAWCDGASWAGQRLHGVLLRALQRNGFKQPTAVQRMVLPLACVRGRDVLCASPTGSGKTLAFALPALHDALEQAGCEDEASVYGGASAGRLRTLVVAPTRELALQLSAHFCALLPPASATKHSSVVACVTGGLSEHKQARVLDSYSPPIVIATPGRLWDAAAKLRHIRDALAAGALRYLIIDEADRMLEGSAFPELSKLADALKGLPPDDSPGGDLGGGSGRWQTLVFSATLKPIQGQSAGPIDVQALTRPLRAPHERKLEVVDVLADDRQEAGKDSKGSDTISLPVGLSLSAAHAATPSLKLATLYAVLVERPRKAAVFVNAISSARRLCTALDALRVSGVSGLHASLTQRARLRALDRFAAQQSAVLVATDVAARGLDVKDLDLVVHYDVAPTLKHFVHRAGRTARAGASGMSLSLVSPQDAERHNNILGALPAARLQPLNLGHDKLNRAHARAALALDIAKAANIISRQRADDNYLDKLGRSSCGPVDHHGDTPQPEAAKTIMRKQAELAALLVEELVSPPKRRFVVVSPATIATAAAAKEQRNAPQSYQTQRHLVGSRPKRKIVADRRKRKRGG